MGSAVPGAGDREPAEAMGAQGLEEGAPELGRGH